MTEIKVIEVKQKYGSIKDLAKCFSLSCDHVRDLVDEMRNSRTWRGSVVSYPRILRVNIDDFEKFWRRKSLIKEV